MYDIWVRFCKEKGIACPDKNEVMGVYESLLEAGQSREAILDKVKHYFNIDDDVIISNGYPVKMFKLIFDKLGHSGDYISFLKACIEEKQHISEQGMFQVIDYFIKTRGIFHV